MKSAFVTERCRSRSSPLRAVKEARLVERKVCFISDADIWDGASRGQTSVQRPTPPTDGQWARALIDRRRALRVETTQSSLAVILKLVISGLTRVILVTSGTVDLQFQGQFVSISSRPVLGITSGYVMATV